MTHEDFPKPPNNEPENLLNAEYSQVRKQLELVADQAFDLGDFTSFEVAQATLSKLPRED